jgi:hypothetical protein
MKLHALLRSPANGILLTAPRYGSSRRTAARIHTALAAFTIVRNVQACSRRHQSLGKFLRSNATPFGQLPPPAG